MTFDRWWREHGARVKDGTVKAAAEAAWEAGRRDLLAVTSRAALTPMQQQVLDIAIDHWAMHGRSPTQQ